MSKTLDYIALIIVFIGALNWGLIGLFRLDLMQRLRGYDNRMASAMEKQLKLARQRLAAAAGRRVLQSPMHYIQDRRMALDYVHRRLSAAARQTLDRKKQRFVRLTAALDAMSPLKVLGRGYALVRKGETVVRSAAQLAPGDRVELRLADGTARAEITEIKEEQSHG